MKSKLAMWSVLSQLILFGYGCDKEQSGPTAGAGDTGGCPHGIKASMCPFCTPALVDSEGFCGEHGVAEALCYQCRPYLKAAFRAKGDWCSKHNAPDSQCVACHAELAAMAKPGSGHGHPAAAAVPGDAAHCPHKVERAKCPFCNPGLIDSEGFCKEHDIAEALCHRCRPYLKIAFQEAGDWCKRHDVPESQCSLCHTDLKKGKPASGRP